jgi:hypothetical protein
MSVRIFVYLPIGSGNLTRALIKKSSGRYDAGYKKLSELYIYFASPFVYVFQATILFSMLCNGITNSAEKLKSDYD